MDAIRGRVASRALTSGDRVPSIRHLAATMRVASSTVVEAYDRLVAEGTLRARRGSGFFVSATVVPPLALADPAHPVDREVDPFWVSRQSLDADPRADKPGCGWLPPEWMPTDALRSALRAVARAQDATLVEYGSARGSPALRRVLLARLARDGMEVAPDQLLLANSGTQAIDLLCRYLLRPGETVIVDDPCYFNFRALLRAHQVRVVGVPWTPSGPDVDRFEAMVAAERPRLYITNSAVHNPTGATLAPHVAHRVLRAAAAHDLTIVEDDIFNEFDPDAPGRLASLDGLQRVVRVGSFSKTISASARCGYIAARADWVSDLADLQIATNFGGPSPIAADAIARVLASGTYRKHVETLWRRLALARRTTAARLSRLGVEPWLMPRGGFFLWARLPEGCDSAEVARAALAQHVVLAPGNVFSVSQTMSGYMRFNVAQTSDAALRMVAPLLRRGTRAGAR